MKRNRHTALVLTSITLAAALMIWPLPESLALARPPLVAMVVIYWRLESPLDMNLGVAFLAGLLVDLLIGEILGLNALGLVVIAYIVGRFRLRIRFFPLWQQAALVLAVLLNDRVITLWIGTISGRQFPGWSLVLGPLAAMLIWPWLFIGLDALRRRQRSR